MPETRSDKIRVERSIERILAVSRDERGRTSVERVYRRKRKRRRSSRSLRAAEEQARHAAEAQRIFINDYLSRHDRSNRRRTDGWYFDLWDNVNRAARKARRHYEELEEDDYDNDEDDEEEDEDDEEEDEDDEEEDDG